jgi:hypothetical protein
MTAKYLGIDRTPGPVTPVHRGIGHDDAANDVVGGTRSQTAKATTLAGLIDDLQDRSTAPAGATTDSFAWIAQGIFTLRHAWLSRQLGAANMVWGVRNFLLGEGDCMAA